MSEPKDLPKPEPELPKPEEDLPLPEKEITSGPNITNTNNKESKSSSSSGAFDSKSILVIILLLFLYPIGMIAMWFMTRWSKWVKIILTIPFVLGIIGLFIGIFVLGKIASNDLNDKNLPPNEEEQVFCTQEAMLCPDGVTYVGREGPNCEFAQCPEVEPEDISITPIAEELENLDNVTEEAPLTDVPTEIAP